MSDKRKTNHWVMTTKNYVKKIKDYSTIREIKKKEKTVIFPECLYTYDSMKKISLNYLSGLQITPCQYKFSKSSKMPTLYAAVFAFMIQAFFEDGGIENKKEWIEYFNSFQRDDGLFSDISGENSLFENGDGWGARHLAGLMIIVYVKLGVVPGKEFNILNFLHNPDEMIKFLDKLDFDNRANGNKIMNYGVLLQYSRDFLGIDTYNDSIVAMEEWLVRHINPQTGLWNGQNKKVSLQE